MNTNLEATLSQTLGRALGLPSGASELALARADREQLGTALMHSLTGQNLLSPADVYRTGRRTVPQIYIGDYHVGGCDDLFALDHDGKLDALLKGEAA